MKNILFIFAHMDDEAFCAGTIKRLVSEGHTVNLLTICGNGLNLEDTRIKILEENIKMMGITDQFVFKYFDLTLIDLKQDVLIEIKNSISNLIKNIGAEYIYTNNSGDIHTDHKVVSNMIRELCRPRSCDVKGLYEIYIPGSAEYGTGTDDFNHIVDITEFADYKKRCLLNYDEYLKGASSMVTSNAADQYHGELYGYSMAEIFKCVYNRE